MTLDEWISVVERMSPEQVHAAVAFAQAAALLIVYAERGTGDGSKATATDCLEESLKFTSLAEAQGDMAETIAELRAAQAAKQ